jgi:hypothetical protein
MNTGALTPEPVLPACTNCGSAFLVLTEVWNDGYGMLTPTGRRWCSEACRDATIAVYDQGRRRLSLSDVSP